MVWRELHQNTIRSQIETTKTRFRFHTQIRNVNCQQITQKKYYELPRINKNKHPDNLRTQNHKKLDL